MQIIAPEELFLAPGYDPDRSNYGKTAAGPLGFGVEIVTAVALPLVYKFAEALVVEVGKQNATPLVSSLKKYFSHDSQNDRQEFVSKIELYLKSLEVPDDKIGEISRGILTAISDNKTDLQKILR